MDDVVWLVFVVCSRTKETEKSKKVQMREITVKKLTKLNKKQTMKNFTGSYRYSTYFYSSAFYTFHDSSMR